MANGKVHRKVVDHSVQAGELPSLTFTLTRSVAEGVLETCNLEVKSFDMGDAVDALGFLLHEYDKRKSKDKED